MRVCHLAEVLGKWHWRASWWARHCRLQASVHAWLCQTLCCPPSLRQHQRPPVGPSQIGRRRLQPHPWCSKHPFVGPQSAFRVPLAVRQKAALAMRVASCTWCLPGCGCGDAHVSLRLKLNILLRTGSQLRLGLFGWLSVLLEAILMPGIGQLTSAQGLRRPVAPVPGSAAGLGHWCCC